MNGNAARATFHFLPPSHEEQRAFFGQLIGAILCLLIAGVLALRTSEIGLRGVLIGAGVGVLFIIGKSAWQLETKARRAQNAEIGVDASGLQIVGADGTMRKLRWNEIESSKVQGGRLHLQWRDEESRLQELELSAREIENGMELIRLIAARGQSTPAPAPPSNFIPLSPK